LAVSAPEIRAFLIFLDALALDVGRRDGMVIGKHRNNVLAAAFILSAGETLISAA